MMTRRDYRAVAFALKAQLEDNTNDADTVANVARAIANQLKLESEHFRYDYFFDAVGLDKWGHVK
jgi:hypothetical protein